MKTIKKEYVKLPVPIRSARGRSPMLALYYLALSLLYLIRAAIAGGVGTGFHFAIAIKSLRLAFSKLPRGKIYGLLAAPMDSFRYFEFDFFWKIIKDEKFLGEYLDISSPRLFSLRVIKDANFERMVLVNPDKADLRQTKELFEAAGVANRCEFHSLLIGESDFSPNSFDTITCISVLEHIPEDAAVIALESMWNLLRPGGQLLLSVPCAREAYEEYTDFNEYGLLENDERGFVFGQRFYDENLLKRQIYEIVGVPVISSVYGEKRAGVFFEDRISKLSDENYPFWKESLNMNTQYESVASVDDLQGVGVIAFKFVKK